MTEPPPPTADPRFLGLSAERQVSLCKTWLEDNPGHSNHGNVQFLTDALEKAVAEKAEAVEKTVKDTMKMCRNVYLRDLFSSLPFLNDQTDSDANIKPEHTPRARSETTLDFLNTSGIPDHVWGTPVQINANEIRVQSENDVVVYLKSLYDAIIHGLGLEEKLCVVMTRMIAGIECDIIIAAKHTMHPLSVTEAKKPHSEPNDKNIFAPTMGQTSRTVGQNYNQLHNVKFMMGLERVYGMISTGNSFMLTCTDQFLEDELACTQQVDDEVDESLQPNESPKQVDRVSTSSSHISPTAAKNLFTSQIVQRESGATNPDTNKTILIMMILQVHKAHVNLILLNKRGGPVSGLPEKGLVYSRQIELVRKDREGFRQNFKAFRLRKGWRKSSESYVNDSDDVNLLTILGSGASGDCCFGISENQKRSCAVKFFWRNSLEQAEMEKANWDRIYWKSSFKTIVVPLGEKAGCLVMPYVKISSLDRTDVLQCDADLRAALREFASSKIEGTYFLHQEVKWRHLGYFQEKLMLVDLGSVEETSSKDALEKWIDDSVKTLTETKGQDQSPLSPPTKRSRFGQNLKAA
jgi:Family of unknown function (DUF5898)